MNPQVKLFIVRKLLQQSNSLHDGQMIIYILLKKRKKIIYMFFLVRFNEFSMWLVSLYIYIYMGKLHFWSLSFRLNVNLVPNLLNVLV